MAPRSAYQSQFGLALPEHKLSQVDKDAKHSLEIIGAGLPRCGTSSLKAALEELGFGPCHHMVDCFDYPVRSGPFAELTRTISLDDPASSAKDPRRVKMVRELMRGYRAIVDAPGSDLYRELLEAYPDAKVILNVRDSPEAWFHSVLNTLDVSFHWKYLITIYPIGFIRKQTLLAWSIVDYWSKTGGYGPGHYVRHNQEVREYVPAKQLLEFNVKQGWEPLCKFLDVPVPKDKPFPHANDTASIQKALTGAQMMGVVAWVGIFATLGGLSYLVRKPPAAVAGLLRR